MSDNLTDSCLSKINELRANPKLGIFSLQKMLERFQGSIYKLNQEIYYETEEGQKGVMNAIEFLSKQRSLGILNKNFLLQKLAKEILWYV